MQDTSNLYAAVIKNAKRKKKSREEISIFVTIN